MYVCVRVCVFACFFLLLILWIRVLVLEGWVSGLHMLWEAPGHRSGTFSLILWELILWKTLKRCSPAVRTSQFRHLCFSLWLILKLWSSGKKVWGIKSSLCFYLSVGNLKFYVCLNWIIICNFQCFFPLFAINYTQWKIMIFTFFEWAVHWNSAHL